MSRQAKIFLLTHAYPFYIILDFQFNLGDIAFNIVPPLIMCLLLYVLVSTCRVNLRQTERRSIWFLITAKAFISIYYEMCIIVLKHNKAGYVWIRQHNINVIIFIIFIALFYGLNRNGNK